MTNELNIGDYVIGVRPNGMAYAIGNYDGKIKSSFLGDYALYYKVVWGSQRLTFKAKEVVKITESKGQLLNKLLPLVADSDKPIIYYAKLTDTELENALKDLGKAPKAKPKAKTKPKAKAKPKAKSQPKAKAKSKAKEPV